MKYSRTQVEFLLDRANQSYPAGTPISAKDMNSKFNGVQVEFLLDRIFDNLCGFNSSLFPYRRGQLCTFAGQKFVALRDCSAAPYECLTDENGNYLKTENNEYIVVGGRNTADWGVFS